MKSRETVLVLRGTRSSRHSHPESLTKPMHNR